MVKYSLGRLAIIFFVSIIAIVFIVDELEDTIVYHERSERFEFSDGETHAYQYTIKEERTLYVVLVETSCYFSDWSASYMVKDDEGNVLDQDKEMVCQETGSWRGKRYEVDRRLVFDKFDFKPGNYTVYITMSIEESRSDRKTAKAEIGLATEENHALWGHGKLYNYLLLGLLTVGVMWYGFQCLKMIEAEQRAEEADKQPGSKETIDNEASDRPNYGDNETCDEDEEYIDPWHFNNKGH